MDAEPPTPSQLLELLLQQTESEKAEEILQQLATCWESVLPRWLEVREEAMRGQRDICLPLELIDQSLLQSLGDRAAAILIRYLEDPQRAAQSACLLARLGQSCIPILIDELRKPTDQSQVERQAGACLVLSSLGDLAIPALIETLSDDNGWTFAALALARMGPDVMETLLLSLEMQNADGVGVVVQEIGPEAYPLLLDTLATDRAQAAVFALIRIGRNVAPDLAQLLCDPVRGRYAYAALVQLGIEAVESLMELLESPNESVRYMSANTLGRIGQDADRAIPSLTDLVISDPNSLVREAAQEALSRISA